MPLFRGNTYLKWYLWGSPILLVLTWVLFSTLKILPPGTPLLSDDNDAFILYSATWIWLVIEFLGCCYLFLSRFSFFRKIKITVLVVLVSGYGVTWIFGVPACQKAFIKAERAIGVEETPKGRKMPWWEAHVAFPVFPFILVTHEGYEYGFQKVKNIQCLYFWNGHKVFPLDGFVIESD